MRCLSCGGEFKENKGSLLLDNTIIGGFSVHGIEYKKCNQCNKLRFSAKAAKLIEETKKKIERKLIGNLPISDFIGATAAAKILNISRQAMHKHRRIRRGFIYYVKLEGKILYNIKSVKLFKENGDGRFQLHKQTTKKEVKYLFVQKGPHKDLLWDIHRDKSYDRFSNILPSVKTKKIKRTLRIYGDRNG
ncbi:hypothetical protein [Desulfobacula sp.]|uniref:hypothetical protein n=1 Tax=Desulfobacula sp. TaxID=2593537 RepID=UPI00263273C9|nr:hypothetical protein [Desulfobacula sp.]